jgi:hypothetical protein
MADHTDVIDRPSYANVLPLSAEDLVSFKDQIEEFYSAGNIEYVQQELRQLGGYATYV